MWWCGAPSTRSTVGKTAASRAGQTSRQTASCRATVRNRRFLLYAYVCMWTANFAQGGSARVLHGMLVLATKIGFMESTKHATWGRWCWGCYSKISAIRHGLFISGQRPAVQAWTQHRAPLKPTAYALHHSPAAGSPCSVTATYATFQSSMCLKMSAVNDAPHARAPARSTRQV
jgi:hypothetical protein